jgi:cysteine desulfurase
MTTKPLPLPIYMDHNATTPIDPGVKAAMEPYLTAQFGNPSSSSHAFGWQAQIAVRKAREQVAGLLGCEPNQVIWTSGATESDNLAILGLVRAFRGEKPHIITQATEHKAVLEVCEAAAEWGAEVTVLGVDSEGLVRLEDLERAITPRTVLISIMTANNEIGALQPVAKIAALCRERKIIFHSDAAQSVGKCATDLKTLPIDMLSLSGHKIYAPKGIGALILKPANRDFELKPIMFGGDQEKSLRPGTLNVPGIVGLGAACEIAKLTMREECLRLCAFQTQILDEVIGRFPGVKLNGPRQDRLCNNISLSFADVCADDMVLALGGVAFSSGSACNSANAHPSHVLKACGLGDSLALATIRLGLGRFTTAAEVRTVTDKLLKMLEKTSGKMAHA